MVEAEVLHGKGFSRKWSENMKKFKYVLLIFMMITLGGCVKYDSTMDIKINKSMDFSMSMALDKSLLSMMGDEDPFGELDISEAEKYGFEASAYEEGNMKGVKLEKKVKNIDKLSNSEDKVFDLSDLAKSEENFIFQVKKGFFKNIYVAKIKFEKNGLLNELPDSDSNLNDSGFDLENSPFGNIDYESMLSSMDLKFNVHLPFGAISNNATNVLNHNKDLVWDLVKLNNEYIEFEFSLYNWIPIIVILFVLLFLIVMGIILFKSNHKKNKKDKDLEPLPGLNVTTIPIPENPNQVITEARIIQPTINNSVQPSVTVPMDENCATSKVLSEESKNSAALNVVSPIDENGSIQTNVLLTNVDSNASNPETALIESNEIKMTQNSMNEVNYKIDGTQVNNTLVSPQSSNINSISDSNKINSTTNGNVYSELDAPENYPIQSTISNANVQASESNLSNNLNVFNTNQVSSNEKNLDIVNGQIMQDLKVEDVFNVTQIQEIENGQIKNPNDNGV